MFALTSYIYDQELKSHIQWLEKAFWEISHPKIEINQILAFWKENKGQALSQTTVLGY